MGSHEQQHVAFLMRLHLRSVVAYIADDSITCVCALHSALHAVFQLSLL